MGAGWYKVLVHTRPDTRGVPPLALQRAGRGELQMPDTNGEQAASEAGERPSKLAAWTNALAITLLGLLLGGLGCFVLFGNYLLRQVRSHELTLFEAAVRWEIAFSVAMAIILAVIVAWQRARGSGLTELGWGRPTTPLALVLAVLLGIAFLSGNYFGAHASSPALMSCSSTGRAWRLRRWASSSDFLKRP